MTPGQFVPGGCSLLRRQNPATARESASGFLPRQPIQVIAWRMEVQLIGDARATSDFEIARVSAYGTRRQTCVADGILPESHLLLLRARVNLPWPAKRLEAADDASLGED